MSRSRPAVSEYSPFTRSRASKKRKRLLGFYKFDDRVYYDGGKAWILKGDYVHGKLVNEKWVRAPKYDKRGRCLTDDNREKLEQEAGIAQS